MIASSIYADLGHEIPLRPESAIPVFLVGVISDVFKLLINIFSLLSFYKDLCEAATKVLYACARSCIRLWSVMGPYQAAFNMNDLLKPASVTKLLNDFG